MGINSGFKGLIIIRIWLWVSWFNDQ